MKHRLPKPKSKSELKRPLPGQSELPIDGEAPSTHPGPDGKAVAPPEPVIDAGENPTAWHEATAENTVSLILPPEDQKLETFSSLIGHEGPASPLAARKNPPPLPGRVVTVQVSSTADENSPLLIQTHGLVKQYGGRRVVNGVDIHVRAGEVVGLLGKNGAGKTTTFYMIVGLVPPTEGHVYMGEEEVTHMPMYRRARRGIGYLPQEESIFRKLTVEENLLAILETLPLTEAEREARCDELLHDFGLEHVRENIAITLSGGEKRRVTIARALVTSPTLLLLDEPFSGVDPMAVHDIQEIILHLKERGLGVLITDHNVRETLSVVDRAYIIDEGRVLSQGSGQFLINDPVAREIYLGHRFSM
jgi:lipopolysaccharide export system ATP-binding protein